MPYYLLFTALLIWTSTAQAQLPGRLTGTVADSSSGDPLPSVVVSLTGTLSPKLGLVFGPWRDTELYLSGGLGFHSNDARGVTSNTDPATPLPRSKGAEVGVRTALVPGLQSSISLWMLDLKSELLWVGDAGSNEPSGPTRRYGIEVANFYTPVPWLTLDADYAWSHARDTTMHPRASTCPRHWQGPSMAASPYTT